MNGSTDRPGPVRHAGADAAQGDILLFADAHVLFSPGFFKRVSSAMRNEIWDRVGSLHVPVGWNGVAADAFSTHYELTLDQNFNFQTLTEIIKMWRATIPFPPIRWGHAWLERAYAAQASGCVPEHELKPD